LDLERKSKIEMNPVVTDQVTLFLALIEQTGTWALRVGFTLAVVIIVLAGVFIWHRRQQFLDAIQMLKRTSLSSETIVRRKSSLFGAA
jgi:hypothetical protein